MNRERALKVVLVVVGLLFSAGVYPVADSLWHANANQSEYGDDMMLSLYVTLGIFLLLAARNPSANRSLVAFTAWSSFAHATVMSVLGFQHASERAGFLGGSALLVVRKTQNQDAHSFLMEEAEGWGHSVEGVGLCNRENCFTPARAFQSSCPVTAFYDFTFFGQRAWALV